jgi:hypothetical protein
LTHEQRITATADAFDAALARFLTRVETAPRELAERPSADGGWSPAGIAWHVAAVNERFAGIVAGTVPGAKAPDADFQETPFAQLTSVVPDQLEAPARFHPPEGTTQSEAVALARASGGRLSQAIREMPESRGLWTITSILGEVTVYQVGEWATAHVIRHNAQAKRAIGK